MPATAACPPSRIERLVDAVDHGHELSLLLADIVSTAAADHAGSGI
ncbi:hypothetical protein [Streptomyces sp. NPDC001296]